MDTRQLTATATVVGGLALFADLGLHAFGGLGIGYSVVATVMAVALACAPWALRAAGVIAPRGRVPALLGTAVVAVGAGLWVAAFVLLAVDPSAAFTQRLTPGGSALLALGMVLVGIGVLRSGVLAGWRAWLPLAVGLYFPVQLGLQLGYFLDGRDASPGPNGLLLGAWGLLWAATGVVAAVRRPVAV